jgi:hypothetical protein
MRSVARLGMVGSLLAAGFAGCGLEGGGSSELVGAAVDDAGSLDEGRTPVPSAPGVDERLDASSAGADGEASAPAELCNGIDDDHDGVNDEGCPRGLSWVAGGTSLKFNKPNGLGPFSDPCPDDKVLIGADGRAGADFQWVQGACAALSVVAQPGESGKPYAYRVTVGSDVTFLPRRGANDTLTFSVRCPLDTVAVGITGQAATSGTDGVSQLNFTCAPLLIKMSGTSYSLERGETSTVSASGTNQSAAFTYLSEPPNVLTGLSGRAPIRVESIGTFDRKPALTLQPATP